MKRISTILLTLLLITLNAVAQQAIRGVVIDTSDDSPIVGASVFVAGTKTGTATEADGRFTINAKVGETLNVTYVGMRPVKAVIDSRDMTIYMESDSKMLD